MSIVSAKAFIEAFYEITGLNAEMVEISSIKNTTEFLKFDESNNQNRFPQYEEFEIKISVSSKALDKIRNRAIELSK